MSNRQRTTTNTSQRRDPYDPARPGLNRVGSGVDSWLQDPSSFETYTGPRTVQMSDRTRQGLDTLFNSDGLHAAEDYLTNAMTSDINPHLSKLDAATKASLMPQINARISASGMSPGSSVDQNLVTKTLGNALADNHYNAFESNRARQLQAASMLPGVTNQIAQNEILAGQGGETYEQRDIDARRMQWEEERLAGLRPYMEAFPLLQGLGGMGGTMTGTNTTTNETRQNPWQTALGTGLMGAGMFFGGGAPLAGLFGGFGNNGSNGGGHGGATTHGGARGGGFFG